MEISASLNNAALKVDTAIEQLSTMSAQISTAANHIERTSVEIDNAHTTELTTQIIKLNKRLFWVTFVKWR